MRLAAYCTGHADALTRWSDEMSSGDPEQTLNMLETMTPTHITFGRQPSPDKAAFKIADRALATLGKGNKSG